MTKAKIKTSSFLLREAWLEDVAEVGQHMLPDRNEVWDRCTHSDSAALSTQRQQQWLLGAGVDHLGGINHLCTGWGWEGLGGEANGSQEFVLLCFVFCFLLFLPQPWHLGCSCNLFHSGGNTWSITYCAIAGTPNQSFKTINILVEENITWIPLCIIGEKMFQEICSDLINLSCLAVCTVCGCVSVHVLWALVGVCVQVGAYKSLCVRQWRRAHV